MKALIEEHSQRIASLYDASALVALPEEVKAADQELQDALLQRQRWFNQASFQLNQGVTLTGVEPATDLLSARERLVKLAQAFEAPYPADLVPQRTLESLKHRLQITFPGDWVVADLDFQVALIAPLSLQKPGIDGLGLTAQKHRAAFKVWTVKNPSRWDLPEADVASQGFLFPFGVEIAKEQVIVDDMPAVQRILKHPDPDWQTLFLVTVKGDYTYLVEAGCPTEIFGSCQVAFQNILDSITLSG